MGKLFKHPKSDKQDTTRDSSNANDGAVSSSSKKKLEKLQSSQMFSPVKDIKDGILLTKDERFVKILEFAPINFVLLPEKERNQIADAFGSAIKIFPKKFQIKILSRQANVESHVRDLQKCIEQESNPKCRVMQEQSIRMIKSTATSGTSRRFFIAYEYEPPAGLRRPDFEEIRESLLFQGQQIAMYLGSQPCNNSLLSDLYDPDAMLNILYECMCRKEAETKPWDVKFADVVCTQIAEHGYDFSDSLTIPINDFIAPRKIDPSNFSYIEIDGKFYSFGYIHRSSYPSVCLAGWMTPLTNMGEGVDIDIFVEQKDTKEVQGKLTYAMQLTRSEWQHKSENSVDLDTIKNKIDSGRYIRSKLSSDQNFCYFSILVTVCADSPEILKRKYKEVSDKLLNMNLDLRNTYGLQDLAFKTSLPVCSPDKSVLRYAWRNIMSGDLGAAYPFTNLEINDPGGIMLGRSRRNNSPLFIALFDRMRYNNGNAVIFGSTGSGKTFTLQILALRLRQYMSQVIIIAPYKGEEFSRACREIGGTFISIAPGSAQNINIMEIRQYDTSNRDAIMGEESNISILSAKLNQLRTFFSLIKPSMTESEWQILDKALIRTYSSYGITDKNSSLFDPHNPGHYKKMPILGDLDRELQKYGKHSMDLRASLSRFITGSAKSFNQPTNVDLSNKYIVIDVSDMPKDLIPIAIFIATDYVYDTIRADPFQSKAIIMDELSKMIGISGSPAAADFVMKLYKTVRSYKTVVISATQDLNDFFALNDGWYGRGILANAKIKLLMKSEEGEIPTLTEQLRLAPNEADQLLYLQRGEGLLIADRNHTEIRVDASPSEHAIITTDPDELESLYGR